MTPQSNKELIKQYLEALRKDKSPATLDKYIVEEDLKHHIAAFEVSFPGYWLEVEDMIAEGDQVFARTVFHGVHKGELNGIRPTGKTVSAPLYIAYKIAHNKIVAHWMLPDNLSIMQQIGAFPATTR